MRRSTAVCVKVLLDQDIRVSKSVIGRGGLLKMRPVRVMNEDNGTESLTNDEAVLNALTSRGQRAMDATLADYRNSILSLDDDYCVIDKPSDVRMDGAFPVTIEKLLPHWLRDSLHTSPSQSFETKWVHQLDFATSGVLCVARHRAAAAAACAAFENRRTTKQYLAVLQGHVRLSDWPQYQTRLPHAYPDSYPYNELVQPNGHNQSLISRKLSRKRPVASIGASISSSTQHDCERNSNAQPVSETDWQEQAMLTNLRTSFDALQRLREPIHPQHALFVSLVTEDDRWKQEWPGLQNLTFELFSKKPKARKKLRKLLTSCGVDVPLVDSCASHFQQKPELVDQQSAEAFDDAATTTTNNNNNNNNNSANEDETEVAAKPMALSEDELQSIFTSIYRNSQLPYPFIYCLNQEKPTAMTNENQCESSSIQSSLIINIPVAEIDDDFRMEVGHVHNRGKASVTEMTILAHAMYKNEPVTKVLFRPLTGRRHQLRIHALALGHPIVGDFTYNALHRQHVNKLLTDAETESRTNANLGVEIGIPQSEAWEKSFVAERMMLHAHSLQIPFPVEGKCGNDFKERLLRKYAQRRDPSVEPLTAQEQLQLLMNTPLVDVTARDPFPINAKNELEVLI